MHVVDALAACRRVREALARGAPWEATDLFRDAVRAHPAHAELLYAGALAYARAGAALQAHALIDRAEACRPDGPALQSDLASLRGRLWKDAYRRAPDEASARTAIEHARREYLRAYAIAGDPYPGVNAATLALLAGDAEAGRSLAREVAGRIDAKGAAADGWDHATAGEALLLQGRFAAARERYREAYAAAEADAGSVASMRRQLKLLARLAPEAESLCDVLPAPDVVAFAGHMIDAPGRASPRFPESAVPAVARALRERLARSHRPVVYTSAACGADLLFAEAAFEAGAEVNVVLPFDRGDFVRTSVAFAGEAWVHRFERTLARAARVVAATDENHLGDDVLFDYGARLVEGLAILRASQLETAPTLLCVADDAGEARVGGALASLARWRHAIGPPETIDLAALRPPLASAPYAAPEGEAAAKARAATKAGPARTLKALLFADVAGYSTLHDAAAPLFQQRFWRIAADAIDAAAAKPLFANSWGDAVFAVFDEAEHAGAFALALQAATVAVDWSSAGLAGGGGLRIALHAGPVFRGFDPIIGRDNFFGSSVTRAARIEPVTPPGVVYASEAFAALLASSGHADFGSEYVGRMALAKGYGDARIYRIESG